MQYKNTILQAKVDADFLVNHNHISSAEFFKNKCLELKKFFSEEQNRTALKMTAEGCALEIQGKNRKFERILLKISPASNSTVVVISSMSLTTDVSALDLGPPAKELENVFFANSSSRRKRCAMKQFLLLAFIIMPLDVRTEVTAGGMGNGAGDTKYSSKPSFDPYGGSQEFTQGSFPGQGGNWESNGRLSSGQFGRDMGYDSILGGLSAQCPFKSTDRSLQSLINQSKVALSALAREGANCPGSQATAQQLQTAFDAALLSAYPSSGNYSSVSPDSPPMVSCDNYEIVLRNEFDLALSAEKNEYVKDGMSRSRYANCMNKKNESFSECAAQTYTEHLTIFSKKCDQTISLQKTYQKNQEIRASLHTIAGLTEELIRNSGNCKDGDKVAKSVLQTAIGSVSAIAAMVWI